MSAAGKRAGLRPDTRTGLWSHMAEAIDQLRPSLVVAENVRGLTSAAAHSPVEPCPWCVEDGPASGLRALGAVLGDLADIGYDAAWCGLRAADVGAPHGRFRIFIAAWPAADAGRVARVGGFAAAGEAKGGRAHGAADRRGGAPTADTDSDTVRPEPVGECWSCGAPQPGQPRPDPTPDTRSQRRNGWQGFERGGRDEAERVQASDHPGDGAVAWGPYEPAIRRWERILGRPAPAPTEPGRNGGPRLSPRFVEWMQGLPAGHVTGVLGITHNDQLKALGNGVVPPQAVEALRRLLGVEAVRAA